ncbi:hypothetical protein GGP41_000224 [Bipolaris sorokiniana]|uniref:Uncharacterized protein n=1 Tax=Cochliobolus sativus TaxID=45130 RepID=A0A8H5ZC32_COCSA|nr:hypothetical protein GGP41_000224 [Bipolaris sorokiniana]
MYVLEIAIVRFIEAPEDKRTRSACGVTGQPRDAKDTILSAAPPSPLNLCRDSEYEAALNNLCRKAFDSNMDYASIPPEINVLLLGDAEVGKSTFLSRLSLGIQPRGDDLPPYELPTLRDIDQPFAFDITLYGRPYRLQFFDTASPYNYTLLKPQFTAQQMLCDRYAECSALTGELCREVLEDIAKTSAKTTTEAGAKSQGPDMCNVM